MAVFYSFFGGSKKTKVEIKSARKKDMMYNKTIDGQKKSLNILTD